MHGHLDPYAPLYADPEIPRYSSARLIVAAKRLGDKIRWEGHSATVCGDADSPCLNILATEPCCYTKN